MIAAYFDDSGTDPKHPALVIGGCVATVENWIDFQGEWQEALVQYGLNHFHMTDFDNKWGDFALDKLPQEKRIPLQSRLLDILKRRIQAIVVVSTNKHDYKSVQDRYGCTVYAYTAFQCLSGIQAWADEVHYEGPIAYFFDQGGGSKALGGKGSLDQLRDSIVKDPVLGQRFRMRSVKSWDYGYAKQMPPLQAADLVAYEAWKDLQNDFFSKTKTHWRTSAGKLIMMERVYQAYFGKDEFVANDYKWMSIVHDNLRL
jgi:Protein of unknown function (DUF3800)